MRTKYSAMGTNLQITSVPLLTSYHQVCLVLRHPCLCIMCTVVDHGDVPTSARRITASSHVHRHRQNDRQDVAHLSRFLRWSSSLLFEDAPDAPETSDEATEPPSPLSPGIEVIGQSN